MSFLVLGGDVDEFQGHPRLRIVADDGSDSFKSLQDGAGNFARGVYSAIRNPNAHAEGNEPDETEALEPTPGVRR
ncbi:TIGR02391 family protein [Amycolatopsis decaplanina]|nr:TIGR02391 family protein [Amycolatopsis decaplanina]